MRRFFLSVILGGISLLAVAQRDASSVGNAFGKKTIRLIYPQWQGGDVIQWIPEVTDPEEASRGYYLGAHLLNFLAPASKQKTFTVPVTTDITKRKVSDGVLDRDIILNQTKSALDILRIENPDRVVTLGGECSVSVAPFTYLADKYKGDVAIVWIDAHPDITLPGDPYPGYHAMALTACMGYGEKKIVGGLPGKIAPDRILLVGLRDWERDEIKARQEEYGIRHLSADTVADDSEAILDWLRKTGASRVLVHFDMDVLDPQEIIAAVGVVPGGMKIAEVIRVINDIAEEKNIVGLTVAEPMPRIAIRIQKMLRQLPLMGN